MVFAYKQKIPTKDSKGDNPEIIGHSILKATLQFQIVYFIHIV